MSITFSVFGDIQALMKGRQLIEIKGARQLLKTMFSQRKDKKPPDYCDLCLPDNYFLSKVIKIPAKKIEADEVNKYIIKQADEVLPINTNDLYLRWKYLNKDAKNKQVLLSAIARKHLDPIIDLFDQEKIDIFRIKPLSSLLSNIIDKIDNTNYIMQVYDGHSVLTALSVNHRVIFSTEEIISTIPDKKTLEKGVDKTRQFISGLNQTIKVDNLYLLGFKSKLKAGSAYGQVDAFKPIYIEDIVTNEDKTMIKDIAIFALSGFSILGEDVLNFLPKKAQRNFHTKQFLNQTYKNIYMFALGFLFLLAIIAYYSLTMFFNLKTKQSSLAAAKNNRISQSEREAEQQAIQINKKTEVLSKLYDQKTNSQQTVADLYNLIPVGISIASVDYSIEKKSIVISGEAYGREDLLTFKEKLGQLGSVYLPITSFVKKNNLGFKLSVVLP